MEVHREPLPDRVENVAFGLRLSEYHTGLRAYSRHLLETIPFERNSDDFVFDQELIAQVVAAGMAGRIGEIAVPTRYFAEASSVGFRRSGLRPADDGGDRPLPAPPAASQAVAPARSAAAPLNHEPSAVPGVRSAADPRLLGLEPVTRDR